MKNFLKYALCCIVSALGFISCETPNGEVASIELMAVEATSSSISFVINAKGDECAYMLYDGDNITAQQVLSEGTKTKSGLVKISNLEANTKYYVAAAAASGSSVAYDTLIMQTNDKNEGDNGGNEDDGGNNGGNNGGDDDFELPEIDGVENIVIEKTKDGRWYEDYNYYVTFVRDNGDRIILDFYTLDETMRTYFPYGNYTFATNMYPFTIHSETSGYVPAGNNADGEGYLFTDGNVSVDVVNGQYAIYMMLTYDENGTEKTIQAYYHGLLSGASIPGSDSEGAKKLIEVLDVDSSSFSFRINAEEGQYWRCSVVDKRVYDQTSSNPGAWVVTYGFMLSGTLTFNWEHGKECEYIPGYIMEALPSTDYIIMAALMDYSEGQENSLLGGVEFVQIRTEAPKAGTGTADITIKEINPNDFVFDCVLGDNVWCCYVALLESATINEIEDGGYVAGGFSSFEECMLSLVPGLTYDFMRQIVQTTYDYRWNNIKYGTEYKMYAVVEDMNKGRSFFHVDTFTTPR